MTTEWMERVAAGLEVHPTELIADEADIALRSGRGSGGSIDHSSGSGLRARDIPIHGDIDLPVLGTARGGSDALMFNDGEVVERVTRPSLLAGATQAYAVYMTGESMEPRYHALELLYVNPARPITARLLCRTSKGQWSGDRQTIHTPERPRRRVRTTEPARRNSGPCRGSRCHPSHCRVRRARVTLEKQRFVQAQEPLPHF